MNERLTARTILFNKKNQILLLQFKHSNETFWLTPGGKIENNETPLMAAKREFYEETGIIDADFITPHSYYFESISTIQEIPTLFKECIFIAYTNNAQTNTLNLNKEELKTFLNIEWWDVHNFINKKEIIYPLNLISAINDSYKNLILSQNPTNNE